jgi:hypothetical protein
MEGDCTEKRAERFLERKKPRKTDRRRGLMALIWPRACGED